MSPTAEAPRGEARRQALLDAAVGLLGSKGPAGVTHRAVATEAGVPLAATTYYFASKEELLREALSQLVTTEVERLQEAAAALSDAELTPRTIATAVARVLTTQFEAPGSALAKFELYLEAARRPELRADATRWIATFTALAEAVLARARADDPKHAAKLLVACIDGLLLHGLAEDGRLDADHLVDNVDRLLRRLLPAG